VVERITADGPNLHEAGTHLLAFTKLNIWCRTKRLVEASHGRAERRHYYIGRVTLAKVVVYRKGYGLNSHIKGPGTEGRYVLTLYDGNQNGSLAFATEAGLHEYLLEAVRDKPSL